MKTYLISEDLLNKAISTLVDYQEDSEELKDENIRYKRLDHMG